MTDFSLEKEYINKGYAFVAGVDEAGRGPLAGDVYAACVILDENNLPEGLDDSKKLTQKKRETLFDEIKEKAVCFSIGTASVSEIDEINILQATFLAMKRAVQGMKIKPSLLLIDGNREPKTGITEITVIKGDAKSKSIAAASILAKVARDRYMLELSEKYPEYAFEKHKGYGTKLHYEKIKQFGISEIHRKSFLKNLGEKH
ncbi:MAG: ribonuclease HII [Candidatus Fimenecus sp.]